MSNQRLSSAAAKAHQNFINSLSTRGVLFRQLYLCFGTWYFNWRHSVEVSRQLRARTEMPQSVWSGFDPKVVEPVCAAIQATCGWPNHRFLPHDPLDLVLDVPFDALAIVEFVLECEDRLGIRLEPGALKSAATVGDAVEAVGRACSKSP